MDTSLLSVVNFERKLEESKIRVPDNAKSGTDAFFASQAISVRVETTPVVVILTRLQDLSKTIQHHFLYRHL